MLACSQNIEGIPKRSTSGGLRESWVPHQSLMEFSWIPNGIAMESLCLMDEASVRPSGKLSASPSGRVLRAAARLLGQYPTLPHGSENDG